ARPLGGSVPNPTFGYGYLNAAAAVQAAHLSGEAPTPGPVSGGTPEPAATPTPAAVPVPSAPVGWQRQRVPLAARRLPGVRGAATVRGARPPSERRADHRRGPGMAGRSPRVVGRWLARRDGRGADPLDGGASGQRQRAGDRRARLS